MNRVRKPAGISDFLRTELGVHVLAYLEDNKPEIEATEHAHQAHIQAGRLEGWLMCVDFLKNHALPESQIPPQKAQSDYSESAL